MNANSHFFKISKNLEKIKWLCVSVFFTLSIIFNCYFHNIYFFIRVLVIAFFIVLAIVTALYTKKGKSILLYIRESTKEMKKIMWPQYKETLYTTFIVISVTMIMSLILWILDSMIFRLITFIISLRF